MRHLGRLMAGLLVLFASSPTALAELRLNGDLTQGGLVQGNTEPGTRITLDGKPVRVSGTGLFIIGFGRDAKAKVKLTAIYADGRREVRTLEIAQRKYRIQRIDGLPARKVTPSAEDMKRIRAEYALINAARGRDTDIAWFRNGFVWPAKGIVSGVYGSQRILNGKPRRPHLGIDIAAPKGTPVIAAADGEVTLAHRDLFFTGGTIIIDHGFGLSTVYSHLSAVDVAEGQRVQQGARIGAVGSTGRSTGAHLDWRVNLFQERLDPALLVGPMPK